MENPGNFEAYRVLANRDQLERAGLWDPGYWQLNIGRNGETHPNRVVKYFVNLDDAVRMYSALKEAKLVALRNWLT